MGYMYNCYSPLFPTEKLHEVTGSVFWNQHAYIHTHIKLQTYEGTFAENTIYSYM